MAFASAFMSFAQHEGRNWYGLKMKGAKSQDTVTCCMSEVFWISMHFSRKLSWASGQTERHHDAIELWTRVVHTFRKAH